MNVWQIYFTYITNIYTKLTIKYISSFMFFWISIHETIKQKKQYEIIGNNMRIQ